MKSKVGLDGTDILICMGTGKAFFYDVRGFQSWKYLSYHISISFTDPLRSVISYSIHDTILFNFLPVSDYRVMFLPCSSYPEFLPYIRQTTITSYIFKTKTYKNLKNLKYFFYNIVASTILNSFHFVLRHTIPFHLSFKIKSTFEIAKKNF